jgi:peroxiredoxin
MSSASRRCSESAFIDLIAKEEKVGIMPDSGQEPQPPASNRRWIIALVAVAGVTLLVWGGLRIPTASRGDGPASAGAAKCDADAKPANLKFTLKDIDGASVDLASYKGKVILLDFWATWCGPCKVEIPGFVDLQNKYRDRGLIVIGVSVDDTIEQLRPFAAAYKMNYPVLLGNGRDDVQEAFGPIWGLPTAFLIGRDGRLCRKMMGLHPADAFEKEILGLL